MEDLSVELTAQSLALIPVVAAVIQVLKSTDAAKPVKQWLPFVAIGLALGLAYVTKVPEPVLPSIVIGLTASGAYDALKKKK